MHRLRLQRIGDRVLHSRAELAQGAAVECGDVDRDHETAVLVQGDLDGLDRTGELAERRRVDAHDTVDLAGGELHHRLDDARSDVEAFEAQFGWHALHVPFVYRGDGAVLGGAVSRARGRCGSPRSQYRPRLSGSTRSRSPSGGTGWSSGCPPR